MDIKLSIIRLSSALKATYTFSQKINCQQIWKMNYIPGKSSREKIWLSILQCKVGRVYSILGE